MATNLREYIRETITYLRHRDCQQNFEILDQNDKEVKVEINWSKGNVEVMVIPIHANYSKMR